MTALCQPNTTMDSPNRQFETVDVPENSSESATATPSPSPATGSAETSTPTTPTSSQPSTTTEPTASAPLPPTNRKPNVREIPIHAITVTETKNGRLDVAPARVQWLANNIAQCGMLNPITVRETDAGYQLTAGLHRLAAAKLLGWPTIHANVQDYSDLTAATVRLAENVQRSNLSPVEQATQLASLLELHAGGAEGIAADLGRPLNWVLDRLDLLRYPHDLLTHLHTKKISLAAAKPLAKIQPDDLRAVRIEQAAHYTISASTARLWLQQTQAAAPVETQTSEKPITPDLRQYETTTTAPCFVCRERKATTQMIPTHVCTTCLDEITTQHTAQAQS